MDKEAKRKERDDCPGKGAVYVVGIGPGGPSHLTFKAGEAIRKAQIVVGYTRYLGLIEPLIKGKEVYASGMTQEVERCAAALEFAGEGKTVAVISSGDSGIYGMAGLILQLAASLKDKGEGIKIEVIPGVPAFVSASAILGAPLMHDFASISLSDLLTPWDKIEERIHAASRGDFVIIFYNPKSTKRVEGLKKAVDIVRRYRGEATPVGIVRNATREAESAVITTLEGIGKYYDEADMLTIIIIGNSTTFTQGSKMVTPRGYRGI